MNINFTKIRLHNFFSFRDTELDLRDMGFTLITGRNYCKLDNAYSNGSGKSSIFNGICFALTGETAQGVSNGVENIFTDPDDCWVELTLNVDNDEFVIKRIKTPRPDMKIYINGIDKSGKGIRESSRVLATYLSDLTPTLVNSIIILGQGLPSRFTNNNPAQRKDILEKLTKSDFMIQSIKDKLEMRQNTLRSELRLKEDSLLANKSKIQVYNSQLENYKNELESYSEFINSEYNLDQQIESVEKEISSIKEYSNVEKETSAELNNTIEDLTKVNLEIANRKLDTKELDSAISEQTTNVNDLNTEIYSLKKEIKQLDSITDICPTCGQKIPNVNKPDTSEKKAKLDTLTNDYNSQKEKLNTLCSEKDTKINAFDAEIKKQLKENNIHINNIKEQLNASQSKQAKFSADLLENNTKLTVLVNLKNNYEKLLANMNDITIKINELTTEVDKTNLDITNINSHLGIIQQMITLAKREFRGILLLNIIEYINKKVKQYSQEVFGTKALDFTLNENSIDITYCDKPYENLSGGEKQKIDVIVQLALRSILSKQLNIHSNLLVCDEIFDNLDTHGCNKIMSLISNLTDIDSIFIISHHAQDLEITEDNDIVVEKDENGISTLKFV